MTQTLTGIVIRESLVGSLPSLVTITNEQEWTAENSTDNQPKTWTALTYRSNGEDPDLVARSLSQALKNGPWYTNFTASNGKVFIIFPGKVIQYRKGDVAGRELAASYARQLGIPDSQLDWAE